MAIEKLLPQNADAEAAVLGALLIDPEAMVRVASFLRADDFYREAHRTIYQAALDLYESGEPADFITLTDELSRRGNLEEVGGDSYISGLAKHVPTSANIEYYARIIERQATLRRLIQAAGQIAAVAYNEADANTACDEAQKLLDTVSTRRPLGRGLWFDEAVDAFLDETITAMEQGEAACVWTGDPRVDAHCAGFQPGELIYLAARPGIGKSTVAASWIYQMAETLAARGGPGMVEWVTLEMRATQQVKRLLSSIASIDGRVLRANFRAPDGQEARFVYQQMKRAAIEHQQRLKRRIHYTDQPTTITALRDLLIRQLGQHALSCCVVDYLGLVEPENAKQDTYQRVTDMSRRLKQIALELQIPIICLVQLNRETEKRTNKRPMLSDLRDSGGLEQDADWVFGLYRGAYYNAQRARLDAQTGGHFGELMELLVLKAREGVANVVIPMRFEGAYTRVTPWPETWEWEHYVRDDSGNGSNGGEA